MGQVISLSNDIDSTVTNRFKQDPAGGPLQAVERYVPLQFATEFTEAHLHQANNIWVLPEVDDNNSDSSASMSPDLGDMWRNGCPKSLDFDNDVDLEVSPTRCRVAYPTETAMRRSILAKPSK